MSFLKEFKEDLSLAISELLPQELDEEEIFDTEGNLAEKKKEVQPSQEKSQEKKAESQKSKGKNHQKNNEKKDTTKKDSIKKDAPKDDVPKQEAEKKDEIPAGEDLAEVINLEALLSKEPSSEESLLEESLLEESPSEESLLEEPISKEILSDDLFPKASLSEEPLVGSEEVKQENEKKGDVLKEPAEEKEKPETMEQDNNKKIAEAEKTMDEMMTGTVETEELKLDSMDVIMPGSVPEEDIVPEPTLPRKSDEIATITAGTRINGDIESDGSLEILGTIHGNVTCNGKLTVTGTLVGNSNADEVYADSAKIEGEINSGGAVKIGLGSVILGNVNATSAVIAGAIRGDIDVHGPVIVDTSAVVMGNIKSRSVQINNGAVIEGFCSQCYSDVSVKNFFEENKPSFEKKSEKKSDKK